MSTHWGYHCKTCPPVDRSTHVPDTDCMDADSNAWLNHGDEILRRIAALTPHFRAIREGEGGWVEVNVLGAGPWPIEWLLAHEGHDIELMNEYGDVEPIEYPEEVRR